jgi:LmbE family N-acetylglucosaminyl deacetylase
MVSKWSNLSGGEKMKNLILILIFLLFSQICFTKSTSLYIFAHQDDELLIISRMRNEVKEGVEVYCLWITDGGKGGPPEVREKESRYAMKLTKVKDENLYFLKYPDQESYKYIPEIVKKTEEIIRKIKPDRIYTLAYEGGNIDHDVANFVAFESAKKSKLKIELFEFPTYNYYGKKFRVGEFIPSKDSEIFYTPIDEEGEEFKEQIFDVYKTQYFLNKGMRLFFNEQEAIKKGEPYRKMLKHNYLERPHPEPLLYESGVGIGNNKSFEQFKSAVENYYKGEK